MAARLPVSSSRTAKAATCSARLPQASCSPSVISISPRNADDSTAKQSTALIARLEELVRAATNAASTLDDSLDREREASRTVLHLQERLRLGARMLKAFQAQLARSDEVLAESMLVGTSINQHANEALAKFRADVERIASENREALAEALRPQPPLDSGNEPRSYAFREWAKRV